MTGSVGQARVPREFIWQFVIPFPSLETQSTIVRALDEATTKALSATAHLATARSALERFRQAILVAACSGRLTTDWREAHGEGDWDVARAEDVCSKVQSGTTPKSWHSGAEGIPFLKVYNVVDQRLNFDYRPQFISKALHCGAMRRAQALPGDVVMNIVGPPLGKVAVVTDQYPEWSINQALTLFRPSSRVTTEWLYIFLSSGISVREIMNETRGTVGQVNISLSQCRHFEIPVPSIEEQHEIASRTFRMLSIAHQQLGHIDKASRRVVQSSEAVRAKAFRGELLSASNPREVANGT